MAYETVIKSFLESIGGEVQLVRLVAQSEAGFEHVMNDELDGLIEEWQKGLEDEAREVPAAVGAAVMTRRRELLVPQRRQAASLTPKDVVSILDAFGDLLDLVAASERETEVILQQLRQLEQTLEGHTGKVGRLIAYCEGRDGALREGAE